MDNFYYYSPFRVDANIISKDKRIWEIYIKKINQLPVPIQDLLIKAKTIDFLSDIGGVFSLSKDQSAELSRIVRNILIGDSYIGNMTRDISKRLNLDWKISSQTANAIFGGLFQEALEDIIAIQKEKFPDKKVSLAQKPIKIDEEDKVPFNPTGQVVSKNNIIDLRKDS